MGGLEHHKEEQEPINLLLYPIVHALEPSLCFISGRFTPGVNVSTSHVEVIEKRIIISLSILCCDLKAQSRVIGWAPPSSARRRR